MYHNFINITPTVLFKLQCLIVQQISPLVTVSSHGSLFEFSQQIHVMMMNDVDITWQFITYSKISNALFCFKIVYFMNVYKIPPVSCAWLDWNYKLWVKHIFPVYRKFPENFLRNIFLKSYITTYNYIDTYIERYYIYRVPYYNIETCYQRKTSTCAKWQWKQHCWFILCRLPNIN